MDYIKRGNRLPKLVIEKCENAVQQNHIFVNNTFEIDANIIGKVDIIVGNPPWGAPGTHADDKTKKRQKIMLDWCTDREYPIGDKEPSQAFLWRVLDFMAPEGVCGLLTSAGVLFKINSTTKKFRKEWMKTVCIREVFNFVHIRHSFFKGAVSPFILIQFEKHLQGQTPVEYWAPKQVIAQKKTQAVFISKYDRNILVNQELSDNYTWKINWFGRHSDTVFISDLTRRPRIRDISKIKSSGRGYESCGTSHSADELNVKRAIRDFTSYGSLPAFFNPPEFLHRLGCQNAYIGKKIIIREGIQESGKVKGQIVARFEDSDFAFYRSIYGLKFKRDDTRLYRCILGILWSSFARYYFFNTSAYWGIWNHKLLLEELLYFPIPENLDNQKVETICSIVMSLQQLTQAQTELLVLSQQCGEEEYWEQRLDDAVFDLYDFTEEQRDLIKDCCDVTLPFFYQPYSSISAMPAIFERDISWIKNYAEAFAKRWQPYLADDEIIRGDIHIGASKNVIAFEFYPADQGDSWDLVPKYDQWQRILDELSEAMKIPIGTSEIIQEGIIQVVTDDSIIVIKRNEKRFWTRSLAREDADSTITQRMLGTALHHGRLG